MLEIPFTSLKYLSFSEECFFLLQSSYRVTRHKEFWASRIYIFNINLKPTFCTRKNEWINGLSLLNSVGHIYNYSKLTKLILSEWNGDNLHGWADGTPSSRLQEQYSMVVLRKDISITLNTKLDCTVYKNRFIMHYLCVHLAWHPSSWPW